MDKRTNTPYCAIWGDDSTVILQVDLPGVPKDNINVSVDNDTLTITASGTTQAPKGTWLLRERTEGTWERSFTLDHSISRDKLEASHADGVLTLTLSVKDEVKPRRITIA